MGRSADLPRPAVRADGRPDDTGCGVLHVDMDAFYALVEIRERPELAGSPVVVAGGSTRGVVLSASYEARAFGVRSAMPAARARRLCPQAVFLPPHFPRYTEVSAGVMALFRSITPLVEPLSLDEAFLDVSGSLRRLGMSPAMVGEWIRGEVFDAHRVTCSVGVAPSKFAAKLASGMAKPDGLLVVPAGGVLQFLHPLPVSALWGVGARTAEALHQLGCETVADVAATPLAALRRAVGGAVAEQLHALSQGHDERQVVPDAPEKSVGAEETFDVDVADRAAMHRELLRLAERAAAALRRRGLRGRTVALKLRYPDFTTVSRSRTLVEPTDAGRAIMAVARELLDAHLPAGARVRLLGVRVEQLMAGGGTEQLTLQETGPGWSDADRAADAARSRFGSAAVRPATLLDTAAADPRSAAAHPDPGGSHESCE
ncbi:MAG: DNA polymerase IV [Pseudonocardiaceae bacterium]|nr:DNA polymerase IV [Pseudonocardiaceae bacterium]